MLHGGVMVDRDHPPRYPDVARAATRDRRARAPLTAVEKSYLAPRPAEEDQESDVKWGRGWLSRAGLAGGESQRFPLGALAGHAGSQGRHR